MPRKVIVPAAISKAIGELPIDRTVIVALLTAMHLELPALVAEDRVVRDPGDERRFLHPIRLDDKSRQHVFILSIDDATADDLYLVQGLAHVMRERPS